MAYKAQKAGLRKNFSIFLISTLPAVMVLLSIAKYDEEGIWLAWLKYAVYPNQNFKNALCRSLPNQNLYLFFE